MNMTFEQPKHLNVVSYQRLVRATQTVLIAWAVLVSGIVLIGLRRRAEDGQEISLLQWILGGTFGFWAVGLLRLISRFESSRRRYLELRDSGLFLAGRGVVALSRFVSWSLSPDSIEPRYIRLRLTYKLGFGRKHWTMQLDDETQVSQLREALTFRLPKKDVV